LEYLLLVLALVPMGLAAAAVLLIRVNGETERLNWESTAWPLVGAQVVALVAHMLHAATNRNLGELERSNALWNMLLFQNVGLLGYWFRHVWHEHLGPHR